jgi:hypothetical protein
VRVAQQLADIGHAIGIDHGALLGTVGTPAIGAGIGGQPGKDHIAS